MHQRVEDAARQDLSQEQVFHGKTKSARKNGQPDKGRDLFHPAKIERKLTTL
jgi:hypothetical protein